MHAKSPLIAIALLLPLAAYAAPAPHYQQGPKLVGTGAVGVALQGVSVSTSADGNTAIVGATGDNSSVGAAWVYVRINGVWSQQGAKLVGTGAVGTATQGASVSMSADGNTAILGGSSDNTNVGAAWVFTRSAGVWTQQGAKLVGTGAVGAAHQGVSVTLSADGNTALVGGTYDNNVLGAVWVFTRSGGVWTQQGSKLVGTGAVGNATQGNAVGLSADGNTAVVGGTADNTNIGAAWVYTRSGGVWSQQGGKLVGTGAVGAAHQGISAAISGDGNTVLVGGNGDNGNLGAVWVFTRSGGVWTQQGTKLVCTGATGTASLGWSASTSGSGNTALVGGYTDNSFAGAAWVFTRSGGVWSQAGAKLVGTGAAGTAYQGASVALSADGKTAVLGGYGDNNLVGAAWVFFDPSPTIVAVADVPNDQGGKVSLRWTASPFDLVPGNPIDAYWIWRQVPIFGALHALADGATLLGPGAGAPSSRAFRTTSDAAQTYYWEYVGSQVAHGFPAYSYTAPTTADSVPGSNPYTLFMVEAEKLSTGEYWSSEPDSGYSVDNLPPGPPAPVAGVYSGGATHLHWGESVEADFALYRLYRGSSADFVPGPGNLVTTQPDTGYTDVGPPGSYYKLSAVDAHGNESAFALVAPDGTSSVGDGGSLAFALEAVRPNPAKGTRLSVAFDLPTGAPARLELLDLSGRRVWTREVGSLGPGWHTVNLAEGRRVEPGLYWVRLAQGANRRGTRVAVIE